MFNQLGEDLNKLEKFLEKNRKLLSGIAAILFLGILAVGIYSFQLNLAGMARKSDKKIPAKEVIEIKPEITATVVEPNPIMQQIKEQPQKSPVKPKTAVPSKAISGKTTTNKNGTKTIVVSEGNVNSSELQKIAAMGSGGNTPEGIRYIDETGKYPNLGSAIKNYLGTKLKWGEEISSLYAIKAVDAGDSGWAGQYAGSYTLDNKGTITGAFGYISLNIFYYKNDPYFNDYMKLVFSHEYGHHYTLYYKWMKWELLSGTRFPDSYYEVRGLLKNNTAVDYSLGWENCDAEIIAEDYSYSFSEYGYHAMSETHGNPRQPDIKNWLTTVLPAGGTVTSTPDNPPVIEIINPKNGSTVSGVINFAAAASDDKNVVKVEFYVDGKKISEDQSSPYETSINTNSYTNGNHILRSVAYDNIRQSEKNITIIVKNEGQVDTEKPVISIKSPVGQEYQWKQGDLLIEAEATDNIRISKIELYINGVLAASENDSTIVRYWTFRLTPPSSYRLKVRAYDEAGNYSEQEIIIIKS